MNEKSSFVVFALCVPFCRFLVKRESRLPLRPFIVCFPATVRLDSPSSRIRLNQRSIRAPARDRSPPRPLLPPDPSAGSGVQPLRTSVMASSGLLIWRWRRQPAPDRTVRPAHSTSLSHCLTPEAVVCRHERTVSGQLSPRSKDHLYLQMCARDPFVRKGEQEKR